MNSTAYYHCGVDVIYVRLQCLALQGRYSSKTARGFRYLLQTVLYWPNYLIYSVSLICTVKEPYNRQGRRKAVEYDLNFDKDLISIRSVHCDYRRPYGKGATAQYRVLALCSEGFQHCQLTLRSCQPPAQLQTHNLNDNVFVFVTG
jgi:hypothetical protein